MSRSGAGTASTGVSRMITGTIRFERSTAYFSSIPQTSEAAESGVMTNMTESALAIAVLISSIQTADGTMSSRSIHTSSPAARNSVTSAATPSRSFREYDTKTFDIGTSELGLLNVRQRRFARVWIAAGSATISLLTTPPIDQARQQRC